jgi:hypothetical protein
MRVREANEEWGDRPFILSPSSPSLPYTYQKRIEINKNLRRNKKQDKVFSECS